MRALLALAVPALLLLGCASAPSRPEPAAGAAQLVVQFDGQARTGVKRAAAGSSDSYGRGQGGSGKAFAKVDYSSIDDVIVLIDRTTVAAPAVAELELDRDGFARAQYLASAAGGGPARLVIHNDTGAEAHVVGFSDEQGFEVSIAPGARAEVNVAAPGAYELTCDEVENAATIVHVTTCRSWQGESEDEAFFDDLEPGLCHVTVLAPRLPVVHRTVELAAGRRQTVVAPLTVNTLPRAGK
ncbi:MAG: hypothetical protein IT463_14475 [Planctomycetes bacterium]|nr:hypothetical protein [Planctomycetota bacterium]